VNPVTRRSSVMRSAFAHDAVLLIGRDADTQAPGGAITVALCGRWDHEPPCPIAPHHTLAILVDDHLALRILFAAEPDAEHLVRRCITRALHSGQLTGPDGKLTCWRLLSSGPGTIKPEEAKQAESLARG
jgi:hypothetical protein